MNCILHALRDEYVKYENLAIAKAVESLQYRAGRASIHEIRRDQFTYALWHQK